MNWAAFALKVPAIIQGAVSVVQHIKGAQGAEKKQAVIDSIPASIELIEFGAGKNVLNDPAIQELISAAIDAEAAAVKTRHALQAGILAHAGG